MPSPPSSRSRCRSSTERGLAGLACAGLAALACAGLGCGGDACGPGDAPANGLVATAGASALTYGALESGLNNDCPDPAAPAGVVSVTIQGSQAGGAGIITFCFGRPDLIAGGTALALGPDLAGTAFRVVDLAGSADGCTFSIDDARGMSGTASATGMCGNGADSAGYALDVDGTVGLVRQCGATVDAIDATLRGRVAVAATL